MNIDKVLEKIENLKSEYTEDSSKDQLERWENDLKEAGTKASALQLEVVKKGLIQFAEKVKNNKLSLSGKQELTEEQRRQMFAEIKAYQEVIDYFINPIKYIEYITNEINNL